MHPEPLMHKARHFAGRSALAILPIAAAAPAAAAVPLQPLYSFAGEHSSSGWFMSEASFSDVAAGAVQTAGGVALSAQHAVGDGMFWAWSQSAQETLRRYDVTGIAFAWGGSIDGAVYEDDLLKASFDFTIDFTNTPINPNDSASVSWTLYIGTSAEPYTPAGYQRGPQGWSYSSLSGSFDQPGAHTITGSAARRVEAGEAGTTSQWHAMLVVDWRDSWYPRPGWSTASNTANGDVLSVTTNPAAPMALSLAAVNVQEGQVFDNGGSYTVSSEGPSYKVHGTLRNLVGASFAFERSMWVSQTGVVENAGLFGGLVGASLRNDGRFGNLAGGSFDLQQGSLANGLGGLFGNAGLAAIGAGAGVENEGRFDNLMGGLFGNAGSFSNRETGVVHNAGGADFTNSGALGNALGGVFGNAGSFTNAAGATVNNAGTMNNLLGGVFGNAGLLSIQSGGVFDNAAGATVHNGGTIVNAFGGLFGNLGRLDNAAGASFQNDGTFDNRLSGLFGGVVDNRGSFVNTSAHTVNNDALFDNHGELVNDLYGRFNNGGTLNNHAGATLANWGEFNNSGTVDNAGTLTVQRLAWEWDGVVYYEGGAFTNDGSLLNRGTLRVDASAGVGGGGRVVQTAGAAVVDGALRGAELRFEGGRVEGGGLLGAPTVHNLGAVFAPGGSGGAATLTIDGDYVQAAGAALAIDLGSGGSDLLAVLGSATLGGSLLLNFGADVAVGSSFVLLTAADGIAGSFAQVSSNWGEVAMSYFADGVSVTLTSAVPEPAAGWMFGGGLLALAWARRRGVARRAPTAA